MQHKKLKIGITCYPSTGGSGILATELGQQLAELGHEVHFISHGVPFRLDLTKPNIFFHEVVVNTYDLFKYPDYTLPLAVKMAEVSQKYDLDILHAHYAVPHATAAYLAKQMLGCRPQDRPRVITTLHGTDITLLANDVHYAPIIKYSIEHSCGVTAVSQSLKDETLKTLQPKKDISVIYNFSPLRLPTRTPQEIRKELGIDASQKVVIHISNLRPVKRIPDLLRIAAASQHQNTFKLLILAGASFTSYEALVKELHLEKTVIVREQVMDIENYLQIADIGLYTSDKESFGLGILESMNFAQPVLGTFAGGIPEVIENGVTGMLFPVGDIAGFAEALDKLLIDERLAKTMGEKGRQRAQEKFSTEKITEEYVRFYEKVLKNC